MTSTSTCCPAAAWLAADLVDGVHPGDRGHLLLARAVAENLTGNGVTGGLIR
ncbi:hypothetical protein [Streptomyces sp. cg35]|uniref:hypothetical protein n=1 Tax=Streptomyces sp. cg35 TaxID=3421650 RepID=UPI003D16C922